MQDIKQRALEKMMNILKSKTLMVETDDECSVTGLIYKDQIKSFIDEIIGMATADTGKAFGGCKLCYGKGYATVKDRTRYHADFIGDKSYVKENNPVKPCTCDRGKQIKDVIDMAVKEERERALSADKIKQ